MASLVRKKRRIGLALVVALAAAASAAHARKLPGEPPFKFLGGTVDLKDTCEGDLELGSTALTFKCPAGTITIPYDSIDLMEYRHDISRRVRRMKLKWKVRPAVEAPIFGRKRNRYFTVVYKAGGKTEVIVLDVAPEAMRPYLAEIDLKAGKRVGVKGHEEYD